MRGGNNAIRHAGSTGGYLVSYLVVSLFPQTARMTPLLAIGKLRMIHVANVTKTYSDFRDGPVIALNGVSLEAGAGEILGLLGPNGAGKTTLLRILSTVLKPSSGDVSINGYDVVTQSSPVRRMIGFVSANTGIYDRMTAGEMVEYFGRLHGINVEVVRQRRDAIFSRLKMDDIRDVLGAKMSTGMKQKVSIARALIHEPPVLIFDEATAGLDVLAARALQEIILDLRNLGKCVIYSTHIMREVERLCDRVAIIHRGHILSEGTLPELSERHGQADFEELFFQLIQHNAVPSTSTSTDAPFAHQIH